MKKEAIRTLKLKILKPLYPINDFKPFDDIIKILQEEVRISNTKIITACNIKYSEILYGGNRDEALKNFGKELEQIASSFAPSLDYGNRQRMAQGIFSRYFKAKNSYEKEMNDGAGNPPMVYKKDMPIPINRMKTYSYKKDGTKVNKPNIEIDEYGHCEIKVPLTSPQFNEKWTNDHPDYPIKVGQFTFAVDSKSNFVRSLLNKILNGEADIQSGKLTTEEKNGNITYYLSVAYKVLIRKDEEFDSKKICGVDLGVKYAAVCAIPAEPDQKKFIDGQSVINHCIKLQILRKKAQQAAKYNGKDGHGRKYKIQLPGRIKNKQSNYRMNVNRIFAKDIVEFAAENKCGTIHLEDLSGFTSTHKTDKFLKNWTYYQLQDYIVQYAEIKGIIVQKVNPVNTSITCSVCGNKDKNNRKTQADFICTKCGYSANADYNAAVNIANRKALKTL